MVIKNWHNFVKTKQVSILDSLLSENIIFYSPVVHSPQKGLNIAKKYLEAASLVLFNSSFKYINETHNTNSAICEFECELNNIYINGVDIIEWENYKITSLKVMVRPLKGILLLKEKMAEILIKA
ncbi:MAG: nuclear transport factor 2 family protein [Pelagibacterales bacterium]|nr:nuclear transport factor 2 family protein [Pelagibacterales bacterium]MBT7077677.1 nuclear transport factor 2 family protein [Pelagibacterales bacterium]